MEPPRHRLPRRASPPAHRRRTIDPGTASALNSPFGQPRGFLQALAHRPLGAVSDAGDIVQETYLR
ncbi:MAG: hypothetical protein H7343_17650 [Undibacterium sp.]|nr:hypothetical protein [Opitutaceae bacterium]